MSRPDPVIWGVIRSQLIAWADEMELPEGAVTAPAVIPPGKIRDFISELDEILSRG